MHIMGMDQTGATRDGEKMERTWTDRWLGVLAFCACFWWLWLGVLLYLAGVWWLLGLTAVVVLTIAGVMVSVFAYFATRPPKKREYETRLIDDFTPWSKLRAEDWILTAKNETRAFDDRGVWILGLKAEGDVGQPILKLRQPEVDLRAWRKFSGMLDAMGGDTKGNK
jgi:hypothetical protein